MIKDGDWVVVTSPDLVNISPDGSHYRNILGLFLQVIKDIGGGIQCLMPSGDIGLLWDDEFFRVDEMIHFGDFSSLHDEIVKEK